MRLFLDVGAHDGQTLEEVTKAQYQWDIIFAFEPMPAQFANLTTRFGHVPHVRLYNFGLHDHTGEVDVYGDNANMGATVWPTKHDVDPSVITRCQMVQASVFFAEHTSLEDEIVVKLNCEGAEIPIVNDLLDHDELWKIDEMLIDFDIEKVVGEEHRRDELLERLATVGFTRFSRTDVMVGATHQKRIGRWLAQTGHGTTSLA